MTDRPTDRALSIALETLDQIGSMTKRGRASVSARSTAAFIRTQLESAPTNSAEIGSKSVEPTAEHWRKALKEYLITSCDSGANWIEQRARELAQEDKTP